MGYYKIQQGVLQQRLSKYYFESVQNIFEGYNNFKNKLQEETEKSTDPYPQLESNNPRRNLTDRQIIESTRNDIIRYFETGYVTIFSSIILIARKNLRRIITDFRFLNSRLQRVSLALTMIIHAFVILRS